MERRLLTFGKPKQDPGPINQANRTRPWGVELGFPNYPIRMPMHLLDSKALSSEPAIESLENVGDPGSALGFQAYARRREGGCRGVRRIWCLLRAP